MELTIAIEVSTHNALLSGVTQHGDLTYAPTEAELAQLTPDERVALKPYVQTVDSLRRVSASKRLFAVAPTWTAIVDALKHEMDRPTREAAEREKEIEAWLAKPDEDCVYSDWSGVRSPWFVSDPRVAARIERLKTMIANRRAEQWLGEADPKAPEAFIADRPDIAARWAEIQAVRAAKKAELEAEAALEKKEIAAYVIAHVPEYARAAQDGCDVRSHAARHVLALAEDALLAAGLQTVETYDSRPQGTPKNLAYERADAVRAALNAFRATHEGAPLTVNSIAIERHDLDERKGHEAWRTCVSVSLSAWGHEEELVVCAEENCSVKDDDDDDDEAA